MRRGRLTGVVAVAVLAVLVGAVMARPQGGPILASVTLPTAFPQDVQIVVDPAAGRALVIDDAANMLTGESDGAGTMGTWSKQAPVVPGDSALVLDTRTGAVLRRLSLGPRVDVLAGPVEGRFLSVDLTAWAQAATLIDVTRGVTHSVPFQVPSMDPIVVSTALDGASGRLFAGTLLSPTSDNLTQDQGVASFDMHSGHLLRLVTLPPGQPITAPGWPTMSPLPCSLVFNERAERLFVFSDDGAMSVLDARSGRLLGRRRLHRSLYGAAMNRRGGRIFALSSSIGPSCDGPVAPGGQASGAVAMLDGHGVWRGLVPLPFAPTALVVDDAANRVITTGGVGARGYVGLFDATTGRLLRTVSMAGGAFLGIDRRRGRVFVTMAQPQRIGVLDARTGALIDTIALDQYPAMLAVDEGSGHLLVVASPPYAPPPADPWGWLPAWLRGRLPFAQPSPTPGLGAISFPPARLLVIDPTRH